MKTQVKYGLILGGIYIALSLIFYVTDLEKDLTVQKTMRIVNIAIAFIVTFVGIRELRTLLGGYISFGSGFSTGFMISLIGSAISSVYSYVYFKFINPGMITYIKLQQENEMLNRGMSEEDIEQAASAMEMWTNPVSMALFVFIAGLILGLVISLITAAVLKKEDPSAEIS